MINFLQLVLNGYWYEQNYFPEYLIRELKKAEKENYEAKEFFGKCLDVVEGLKKELDKKIFAEKNFIFNALNNYKEPEKHQDEIAKGYQDMKNLSRKGFPVELFNYTNGEILGTLYYDDILELDFLILNAIDNYNLEIDLEPLLNKYIKTRDFYLLQPFKAPSINKDNFQTWKLLLEISLKRYNYFVNNLPPEDKIQLKKYFSTYLEWIGTGKSNDFKILFKNYNEKVENEFQEKVKTALKPKNNSIRLGRPRAEQREAKSFLNKVDEENKEPFLRELKKRFSEIDSKGFVHLLLALEKKEYIFPVRIRKELFEAFELLLGSNFGTETNKNTHWRNKDKYLVERYEKELNVIKENVFYNCL